MGLCCLEIMSGSNSFAFSISPFLHNPSIGAFDVMTCRTLIDGLCETGQIDKAEKLLLTMISGIHEHRYVICTALIDGLCKKGEIKKAKRLLYKKDGLMLALIPLLKMAEQERSCTVDMGVLRQCFCCFSDGFYI